MECPICGSDDFGATFSVTREDLYLRLLPPEKRVPAVYSPCRECDAIVYQGDCSFDNQYASGGYYGLEGDPAEFLMQRFSVVVHLPFEKSDNKHRVKRVKAYMDSCRRARVSRTRGSKRGERVLDVGAGMGVFLYEFLEDDWRAEAIEPDPHAVSHLRKVMPAVAVHQGMSMEVPIKEQFDLITLNRVLEHIADPLPVLRHERDRLAEGGVMYVEVPDVLSFQLDGASNEAFGIGHHVVYSPLAFTLLARQAELRLLAVQRVKEPSGKFSLYGFLCRESETEKLVPE